MSSISRAAQIDDPDDPRLEPYRDIRERDLVGRGGCFIAEGEVVVRVLAGSRLHGIDSLLLLDSRAERMADLVAGLSSDVPVYVAPRPVLDQVTGFPVHRGVLAIGRKAAERGPGMLLAGLPSISLVLGLVGIANHDNVGGLYRNAAAFGADAVLMDGGCCDPLYRKAIRVSVGHVLTVPFSRAGSATAMVDILERHGFDVVALAPGSATPLDDHRWQPRTALVMGAEGSGLPRDVLARATTLAIPMAPGVDSLNVATSAAIALHAARQSLAGS